MSKYIVEQFVTHSQQFEPMERGEFNCCEHATNAAIVLVRICGYKNIRVVSEDGQVVFEISAK